MPSTECASPESAPTQMRAFIPKSQLLPLLRLMHPRVRRLVTILRRRGHGEERDINNGALSQQQPLGE